MLNFHINAPTAGSTWRPTNVSVDTSIDPGGVVHAQVKTEKSVTNPIYILSTGALGKQDLHSSTKVTSANDAGTGPLADAVKSLHALGDKHGIIGINLSSAADLVGTVMFKDAPGAYVGGGPTTQRVGAENLKAIDDAARTVLGLALAGDD